MGDVISGLHHITAIDSDPPRNLNFYTGVLGLRLIKLTVNFDGPETYHFYFGNETGCPGTSLKLPAHYEPLGPAIESALPALILPKSDHL